MITQRQHSIQHLVRQGTAHGWFRGSVTRKPFSDARRSRNADRLQRFRLTAGLVSILSGFALLASVSPVNACDPERSAPAAGHSDEISSLVVWLHRVGYFGTYVRILPDGGMTTEQTREARP